MGELEDPKQDRMAVAIALLGYSQANAYCWAGFTHRDSNGKRWTKDAIRSKASKQARHHEVERRVRELNAHKAESLEDGTNPSLVSAEKVLLRLSHVINTSHKGSEIVQASKYYLELRADLQRELDSRVPSKADAPQVGSAEHSRRLNAAVQARLARMGGRAGALVDADDDGSGATPVRNTESLAGATARCG